MLIYLTHKTDSGLWSLVTLCMSVSDKASFINDVIPNHWINNEQAQGPKFSKPFFLWQYSELAVKLIKLLF